ncbi:MAG: multiheme c-type cytochrome, partial [Sulfurimonadaceae bacterium]|nr:multiheme c-type cytochrome [Sulfurimonadaceae bacterium]
SMDLLVKHGQENNKQCLPCHTTGFGVKGGFESIERTPRLANVQCEGCHGPGNVHIKYGKAKKPGGLLAGIDNPDRLEKMCKTCHTQRWDDGKHDFHKEYKAYQSPLPKHEK